MWVRACSLRRAALFLLGLSCAPQAPITMPVHSAARAETEPARPLAAEGRAAGVGALRQLELRGFGPAVFFEPAGTDARPLLVAAHGAGGAPEWECEYWRRLTNDRVFVLSLRGTPLGTYPGYYYRDHRALEQELTAADAAARALQPRILSGSGLYAGFSQGATMGSAMITAHVAAFPYLVLVEGFDAWNVPRGEAFARNGGKRILLGCGSKECNKVGQVSAHWLRKANVEARLEFAPGEGHTPMGGVLRRIEGALPWLVADDPAWQ